MRKLLVLILLAGTAAPALAAGDPGDRQGRHRESGTQSASEDRGARSERSERPHFDRGNRGGDDGSSAQPATHVEADRGGGDSNGQNQPATQVERHRGGDARGERRVHSGVASRFSGAQPSVQPVEQNEPATGDPGRRWRGPKVIEPAEVTTEDRAAPMLRQQSRPLPRVLRDRVPIVSNTPHEGTQPPLRTERRRTNWVSWSTSHWRNDHRYDWKDHRRHHRSLFHLGFYFDPFGWNYRPYQIGWRMWPSYYSSRYWISDPWQYRLPYAPPGYRWIRYHDDAVLVDTWSGEVVDVIYNFFW